MAETQHPISSPTRRSAITLAAAGAAGAFAAPAWAAGSGGDRRARPAPETVRLPDGIQPEGITSGPGTTFYVGSLADGRIVTGDLLGGPVRVLLPGAAGRSLRGLYRDARSGLVWAVGSLGAEAHVWAVDGSSGAVVADVVVPGGAFLNDLVVTLDAVWATDSRVDRITRIAVTPDGQPAGTAPTFLPLTGAWPAYDGSTLNANGIRELPDGSFVLNNSAVGGLWQVGRGSGEVQPFFLRRGPALTGGDGLVIDGQTLYDVRGSGPAEVSVLRLDGGEHGWVGTWKGALTDDTLDVPSTATIAGGWLWAVNARFGVASPSTASYWVTRLPLR